MTQTLSDFLKGQAVSYKTEREQNQRLIEEWIPAVEALFDKLEAWLKAADPENLLEIDRSEIVVNEPRMGRYRINRLNIRGFGKWIGVLPKARKTMRKATPQEGISSECATGRVDITDEIRRYILFRFSVNETDQWYIDDIASDEGLMPLTAERFCTAILNYLR
jgi:hypothetical protein